MTPSLAAIALSLCVSAPEPVSDLRGQLSDAGYSVFFDGPLRGGYRLVKLTDALGQGKLMLVWPDGSVACEVETAS